MRASVCITPVSAPGKLRPLVKRHDTRTAITNASAAPSVM
jgi:hypothetical protein